MNPLERVTYHRHSAAAALQKYQPDSNWNWLIHDRERGELSHRASSRLQSSVGYRIRDKTDGSSSVQ